MKPLVRFSMTLRVSLRSCETAGEGRSSIGCSPIVNRRRSKTLLFSPSHALPALGRPRPLLCGHLLLPWWRGLFCDRSAPGSCVGDCEVLLAARRNVMVAPADVNLVPIVLDGKEERHVSGF